MPHELKKLTPNIVVANIEKSLAFYRDVLGFAVTMSVPDSAPYVFVGLQSGPVEVFINAVEVMPEKVSFGNSMSLFVEVADIKGLHEALRAQVPIAIPLEKKFYGMTEFAIHDPDGHMIIFAQPGDHV
jgi:catechol 2,3-dioxygenase-like lactoylglutathione lyase family enzyme